MEKLQKIDTYAQQSAGATVAALGSDATRGLSAAAARQRL
jgi:hypothetical protein